VTDDVCELLCEQELERAERMLDERDRRLWRRSRGVLRALLGRYLRQDPRSLRLIVGAHGKPALAGDAAEPQAARRAAPEAASRLSFNLSHSGHLALYAFSESGDVGVDVEVARRAMNEVAIAARVFGPAQAKHLQELDPDSRRREFLRAWVRHEAERKCLGVGLFGGEDAPEQHPSSRSRPTRRPRWLRRAGRTICATGAGASRGARRVERAGAYRGAVLGEAHLLR